MNGNETKGKWKLWSGVIMVFIIGVIVGGLSTTVLMRSHLMHVMRKGPPRVHERIEERLTKDLALTPEQRAQAERIAGESGARFEEFERRSRAEGKVLATQMAAQIREILTPEQQVKFDAGTRKFEEEFRHREGGHNRDGHKE